MADNIDNNRLSSDSDSDEVTEQSLIEYYFSRGFQYKSIIDFLQKRHGIVISERTLRKRLNEYGLRRRSPSYDINDLRRAMQEFLNGPGNMGEYRSMWHALRTQGLQVPRHVVEQLMRDSTLKAVSLDALNGCGEEHIASLVLITVGIQTAMIS